ISVHRLRAMDVLEAPVGLRTHPNRRRALALRLPRDRSRVGRREAHDDHVVADSCRLEPAERGAVACADRVRLLLLLTERALPFATVRASDLAMAVPPVMIEPA